MVSVDQKTELENQILGSINSLQEDLILVSSIRGEGSNYNAISPAHKEALYSVMNRQYNLDDVNTLKRQGIAGEKLNGLLFMFETEQTKNSKTFDSFARRIISEENHDRSVIMKRVIAVNPNLSARDEPLIQNIMYKLNLQSSPIETKAQTTSGEWETLSDTKKQP